MIILLLTIITIIYYTYIYTSRLEPRDEAVVAGAVVVCMFTMKMPH